MTQSIMMRKSIELALVAIEYCKELESTRNYIFANQLLKSATSIGANIAESREAQSRADFIAKLSISSKEASEAAYWLNLCTKSPRIKSPSPILVDLTDELRRMLKSSIISLKKE